MRFKQKQVLRFVVHKQFLKTIHALGRYSKSINTLYGDSSDDLGQGGSKFQTAQPARLPPEINNVQAVVTVSTIASPNKFADLKHAKTVTEQTLEQHMVLFLGKPHTRKTCSQHQSPTTQIKGYQFVLYVSPHLLLLEIVFPWTKLDTY